MLNALQSLRDRVDIVNEFMTSYSAVRGLEGWLGPVEGYALEALAAQGPGQGEVVEIGSFKGRSTCLLAQGLRRSGRGKVTAVDHFQGSSDHQPGQAAAVADLVEKGDFFEAFQNNLRERDLLDFVDVRRNPSRLAVQGWDKPIRLLFIDGEHTYDAVLEDFALWSRFVVPGGVVAFHDYNSAPGVTTFCEEMLARRPEFQKVMVIESLLVTQRQPA